MLRSTKIKHVIISALFLLLFKSAFSQENFIPGYIISTKSDTIRGYIDYRNWSKNPEKIFFKKQLTNVSTGYSDKEINGFGVANEIYVRATVQIEQSTDFVENMDNNPDLILVTDTVFLQLMIQGPKNLYHYVNKSVKDQFYVKLGSEYQLLIYKRYKQKQTLKYNSPNVDKTFLEKQNYETLIISDKRYIDQLAAYLGECSNITGYLAKTEYSREDLEKLYRHYYDCTNSSMDFQKKTEVTKLEKRILAGASVTFLNFEGDGFEYLSEADFSPSVNISGGFSFDYVFPRKFNRFSFNNELLYSAYKCTGTYTDYTSENEYKITTSTIGLTYLKLNTMIRYAYPIGATSIYGNAGVLYGIALASTNTATAETKFYSTETIKTTKAMQDFRNYEVSYSLGLGAKHKRYSAELRFETGNGMSDYTNLKSKTKRLYVFLGYRF
jgi:hypothetical protein